MKIKWKFWWKTIPKNPTPAQPSPQETHLDWLVVGVVILVLGLLIGTPARKVLWSIPWGSVGLVILFLAILLVILYALWKKPELRKKAGSKWKPILALAALASIVGLGIFGVKKYRSLVKEAEAKKIKADSVWAKQLADRGVSLGDSTFVFTTTVGVRWSPIFVPRKGYCARTEPLNRTQSYRYATRFDTLNVVPGEPEFGPEVPGLRYSSPFSLQAIGRRRVVVVIWHEKANRYGQCPTEHLSLNN